jgi:murein endopeptidase
MQPRQPLPAPRGIITGALAALAVLWVTPGHAEPRRAEPPRLVDTRAADSQRAWMGLKSQSPARQATSAAKLAATRCQDLVDARALSEAGKLTSFDFRDNVRGRTWGRPTLMLLLREAMKRFAAEVGKAVGTDGLIAIGDVSQPGCGQLMHGVIVQELRGKGAEDLLARAEPVDGTLTLREVQRASDFPWEADRFGPPSERVLVLTRILGARPEGGSTLVRLARARYRELSPPTPAEADAFSREVASLASQTPASVEKTERHLASELAREPVWVSHYIAPSKRRQAVLVTRRKPGRRIDWGDVVEVRLANWQDKKPGSFPEEVRWESGLRPTALTSVAPGAKPRPAPSSVQVPWTRWSLVNEAGHISHLSGIDVDLSYVTVGHTRHFAVDLAAMDVARTFRWFEILDETARYLGTPLDSILVDPKVRNHLRKNLPMKGRDGKQKSRIWRLLALSPGHDAHHHVRLVEPSAAREKAARKALGID